MEAGMDTQVMETADRIRKEVQSVVVGQDEVIDELILCLFCGGHSLLIGVPGLAKTLLVSTIARTLSLEFSRIQFTPDLMPSDMTGTEVMEEDKATGNRSMRFVRGPVFANLVLADEINKTPPKTQAALLEAMQEQQVTAGGNKHLLPRPFFVLATQNPIEQEGTYPLPEAQLDRFMFNTRISYPSSQEEHEIVLRTTSATEPEVNPVIDGSKVLEIQDLVRQVPIAPQVVDYALRIVRGTRVGEEDSSVPDFMQQYIRWGAGPRASQYLVLAAKGKAILRGSSVVDFSDIRSVTHPVLRHRILRNFNAEADGVQVDELINQLLDWVDEDGTDPETARRLDRVMH